MRSNKWKSAHHKLLAWCAEGFGVWELCVGSCSEPVQQYCWYIRIADGLPIATHRPKGAPPFPPTKWAALLTTCAIPLHSMGSPPFTCIESCSAFIAIARAASSSAPFHLCIFQHGVGALCLHTLRFFPTHAAGHQRRPRSWLAQSLLFLSALPVAVTRLTQVDKKRKDRAIKKALPRKRRGVQR